jgi:hypothetical protein
MTTEQHAPASIVDVPFDEVVTPPYSEGAIVRDDFPGFREDYLAVHSLLRRHRPASLLEIGTSTGNGTNVICNALGIRRGLRRLLGGAQPARVVSIDVPPGTDPSVIYPEGEDGHPKRAGANCRFPYEQLYGDSTTYDFSPHYPLEAWFVDGKHNYEYAKKDTEQALKASPRLIMWHDMQIEDVDRAVRETMRGTGYEVRRVERTRVAYAVRPGTS